MSYLFEDSRADEIVKLDGSASIHSLVRADFTHRKPKSKEDLIRDVIDMALKKRIREAIEDRYNFDRVRQHLDTLPDIATKLIYLIEIETEYQQVGAASETRPEGFDQKCELEKAKLKGLIEISKPGKLVTLPQNDKAIPLVADGSSAKATHGRQYINLTDGDWETIREMYSDHFAREQENLTQRQVYDKLTELGRIRMGFRTFQKRLSARAWPPLPGDKQT